ncbi:MAG TPA: hypothetical protein VFW13_09910 [Phenylobacterium sp.]|nr:hypothetical protein [Phenylobacterium sp.]
MVVLGALAVAAALSTAPASCHTVHGRMGLWNGAPTVRIAVTGSHRLLGVVQPSERLDDLPASVRAIWTGRDSDADWATSIVGDFEVCPVDVAQPGHLQMVRLVQARRLSAAKR